MNPNSTPSLSERYMRQIGRICGRVGVHRAVLTDQETAALRAFHIGMIVRHLGYARRYPPPAYIPQPKSTYDPEDMGSGFAVGNTDMTARGMHLGTVHPDRS